MLTEKVYRWLEGSVGIWRESKLINHQNSEFHVLKLSDPSLAFVDKNKIRKPLTIIVICKG